MMYLCIHALNQILSRRQEAGMKGYHVTNVPGFYWISLCVITIHRVYNISIYLLTLRI